MHLEVIKSFKRWYAEMSTEIEKGKLQPRFGSYVYVDDWGLEKRYFSTPTQSFFFKLSTQLGYIFDEWSSMEFIPYFNVGYLRWENKIPSIVADKYNNLFSNIGGKWIWQVSNTVVVLSDFSAGAMFCGYGNSWNNHPFFPLYEANLTVYHWINPKINIHFSSQLDDFHVGMNPPLLSIPFLLCPFFLPDSTALTFKLGVGFAFD